jgi:hypothetical protein
MDISEVEGWLRSEKRVLSGWRNAHATHPRMISVISHQESWVRILRSPFSLPETRFVVSLLIARPV